MTFREPAIPSEPNPDRPLPFGTGNWICPVCGGLTLTGRVTVRAFTRKGFWLLEVTHSDGVAGCGARWVTESANKIGVWDED
jgi:hypothetical protein